MRAARTFPWGCTCLILMDLDLSPPTRASLVNMRSGLAEECGCQRDTKSWHKIPALCKPIQFCHITMNPLVNLYMWFLPCSLQVLPVTLKRHFNKLERLYVEGSDNRDEVAQSWILVNEPLVHTRRFFQREQVPEESFAGFRGGERIQAREWRERNELE